jgi:hypothetical protein
MSIVMPNLMTTLWEITMCFKGAREIAVTVLVTTLSVGGWAAEPLKRDQVVKETTEANKAGTIDHHGDAKVADDKADKKKSTVTRDQVKKETASARKSGAMESGDADKLATQTRKSKSEVSRASVKQEAASAAKSHITGEAPPPKP